MLRHAVYARPASPYRALLGAAGCELGDIASLVRAEGVEGALGRLFQVGVYLTVDEFKARRPVVRGSFQRSVGPAEFQNPAAVVHLLAESSGSSGPRLPVPMDLAFNWDHSVNRRLSLVARGALDWRLALWSVPGGGEPMIALRFAAGGRPPERWFSPVDPGSPTLHPRYRWSAQALRLGALLAGVRLPLPSYAPLDDPRPIFDWLAEVEQAGQTAHLKTMPGAAVRLAGAAAAAGRDLAGVRFTLTGEPLTNEKLAILARSGAEAVNDYGSTETGAIGEWCTAPREADDVHLFDDLHAVIQPGPHSAPAALPERALLLTSLRPTAPLLLLNVSLGDQAYLSRPSCGCPMEAFGWRTHLHEIRSFEKLTLEGVNLLDLDVEHILERVLPARFGGSALDYQLVEATTGSGPSRLTLRIHPRVGPLDDTQVVEALLRELGRPGGAEQLASLLLRGARPLRIERRVPSRGASGKVLHLHTERGQRAARPPAARLLATDRSGGGDAGE